MSDPLDDLLEGLEGLEDPEFLAEADAVAREVTESLALDLRASIPYVPSGPVVIRAAGPVTAVAPPVAKVKVTAAERAAIAAEKARVKAAATAEKAATKAAATTAALLSALKEIKALKAFIRAAGLKVPA